MPKDQPKGKTRSSHARRVPLCHCLCWPGWTCRDASIATLFLALSLTFFCSAAIAAEDDSPQRQWPHWRGPAANGVAKHAEPPVDWSEQQNVKWKCPLPGLGHSSPIVWQDLIVVTTAVPVGDELPAKYSTAPGAHDNLPVTHRHQFRVLGINRDDGKVRWQHTAHEALPTEGGHITASLASASPVTDGKRVIACFGSFGLFAYDMNGKQLWHRQLGPLQIKHGHGEGSSPVLADGIVVVVRDHEAKSEILALDAATGKTRWRAERNEVTSWASPVVIELAGRQVVIVNGTAAVRAYDLLTGAVVWTLSGLSANVVASPTVADGTLVVGSSYEIRSLMAVRLAGAKGDITGSDHVLWRTEHRTPYVPSPLIYDGAVYFLSHYQGVLTRLDLTTGEEPMGPFRLGRLRNVYASPVAAADRIYFCGLNGYTQVIDVSQPVPRLVASNRLDDSFSASPAIVGKMLFLRGNQWLYCLQQAVQR